MVSKVVDHPKWQELAGSLELDRGLPRGMLRAIALNETNGGDPKYITKASSAGAQGMFQFMPATAKEHNVDVNDPADSTRGAADELERLFKKYKDPKLAAAAYNWGQGNLDKAIEKAKQNGLSGDAETLASRGFLPAETTDYIRKLQLAQAQTAEQSVGPVKFSPEVVEATKGKVQEMLVGNQPDEVIISALANSPVRQMIADLKNDGQSNADILRQIVGPTYDKVDAVRSQSAGTNVWEGVKEAGRDMKAGLRQLDARVFAPDEILTKMQAQEAAREADPLQQVQEQQTGTKVGTVGTKALPYVAGALLTGGTSLPAQMAVQGGIGAASGALKPTTGEGQFGKNILTEGAMGAGTQGLFGLAGKALGGVSAGANTTQREAARKLMQEAAEQELPVSASNVSPFWKQVAEANPGDSSVVAASESVDRALAQKIGKGLGESGPVEAVDANLLNAARDRIGARLNELTDVQMTVPKSLADDLKQLVDNNANPLTEGIASNTVANKAIANLANAAENGTVINGKMLQALNSELKELTRSQTASAAEKKLAGELVGKINQTLQEGMSTEGKAAFKLANEQYRNLKAAEKMVSLSNNSGQVLPRQILQAVKSGQFKNAFLKEAAPFQELGTVAAKLYGPANNKGLGSVIGKALGSGDGVLGTASVMSGHPVGLAAVAGRMLGRKALTKLATSTNPTIVKMLTRTGSGKEMDPIVRSYVAKALQGTTAAGLNE